MNDTIAGFVSFSAGLLYYVRWKHSLTAVNQPPATTSTSVEIASTSRTIRLVLGAGSSIDVGILNTIMRQFSGVDSFEFRDQQTLVIRGCEPAAEIINHFNKIGTQFMVADDSLREVVLLVPDMMCVKNCGTTVARQLLSSNPSVKDVCVDLPRKQVLVLCEKSVGGGPLVDSLAQVGFDAKEKTFEVKKKKKVAHKMKHVCVPGAVDAHVLGKAFEGVKEHYREQQLQEYSRYKNWKQSCYMEVHSTWNPQPPINHKLYESMQHVLEQGKAVFEKWYKELHGLEDVQVITLNSFITKYIPVEGKEEFGKHVDGAKIDGSLIIALPTDQPNDWPGLRVWDGPKGADGNRPEHLYAMQPGDVCCMDSLIWHHGLPITKGVRYVSVSFLKCKWKQVKMK